MRKEGAAAHEALSSSGKDYYLKILLKQKTYVMDISNMPSC
jgi:hypothetical protein